MPTDTLERRSRWSLSGGNKRDLTATDIEILKTLGTYRALPATYIAPLINRSIGTVQDYLTELIRGPKYFLHLSSEVTDRPNNNQQFIYELGPNGREAIHLAADPTDMQRRYFQHQLMIDTTFASLQLTAEPRFVHPSEILARNTFPAKQRKKPRPLTIPVNIKRTKKGALPTLDYTHDGIRSLEQNGNWLHIQLEAEHTSQTFLEKFRAIRFISQNKLYDTYWGIDNLVTMVVAPNQPKIETMKALILRETGGKGVTYVFFRTIPMFGKKLEPIIDLYAGPCQRAGYPDISIKEIFDGPK